MNIVRLAARLLLACSAVVGPVHAQATADLALEVSVAPAGDLIPGSVALITLTVRNHGPAEATFASVISSGYEFIVGGNFDLYSTAPNACTVYYDHFNGPPGEPHFLVAAVVAGTIPAGGSKVCTLGLFVYPEARGPYVLTFHVNSATSDPNLSNNLVPLDLVFAYPAPLMVPAISPVAVGVLGLLVMGLARPWNPRARRQRNLPARSG